MSRLRWLLTAVVALLIASPAMPESKPANVKGTFVVGGTDAYLKHVRAKRVKLDEKGKAGYAVLLSERPSTGDFSDWRTAEPSKRGSFIFLLLEKSGDIWVAELGNLCTSPAWRADGACAPRSAARGGGDAGHR